jgi:hypothetical protein
MVCSIEGVYISHRCRCRYNLDALQSNGGLYSLHGAMVFAALRHKPKSKLVSHFMECYEGRCFPVASVDKVLLSWCDDKTWDDSVKGM